MSVFVCFSRIFLMGILIFKGLTARRLYKSFGVKVLKKEHTETGGVQGSDENISSYDRRSKETKLNAHKRGCMTRTTGAIFFRTIISRRILGRACG
jgi:hypothetical protein